MTNILRKINNTVLLAGTWLFLAADSAFAAPSGGGTTAPTVATEAKQLLDLTKDSWDLVKGIIIGIATISIIIGMVRMVRGKTA